MTDILNLIPDPQFQRVDWTAHDATATQVTAQYALNVTNTNGGADSFVEYILPDVSEYRGVDMTFACSLTIIQGSATECGNGLIFAHENNSTWNVTNGGTATVGRKVLQFTLPNDVTGFAIRLYAPATNGSTFQWWRPILTRTEDYQRLLAGTGIGNPMDYFDGDTRPDFDGDTRPEPVPTKPDGGRGAITIDPQRKPIIRVHDIINI